MSEKENTKDMLDEAVVESLKEMAIKMSKDTYTCRVLANAIDLIHRLQNEKKELQETVHDMSWVIKIHKYCVGANHCQNRSVGEFELQRQVDELKSENTELYKEHTTLIAGSILEKQEIVKNTAREILGELDLFFKGTTFRQGYEFKKINEKLKEIARRKGVEVE